MTDEQKDNVGTEAPEQKSAGQGDTGQGTTTQAPTNPSPTPSGATENTGNTSESGNAPTDVYDRNSHPLSEAERAFPQSDYNVTVHPEILNSEAFKKSRFLPPEKHRFYFQDVYPIEDPEYQWVRYRPHDNETMWPFQRDYGVPIWKIMKCYPNSRAFHYEGDEWALRIKASLLPHD